MHVKALSYSSAGGERSQLHAELGGSQLWTSQLVRGDGSEQVSRGNSLPLQTESELCSQHDELRGKPGIFYAGDVLDLLKHEYTLAQKKTKLEGPILLSLSFFF